MSDRRSLALRKRAKSSKTLSFNRYCSASFIPNNVRSMRSKRTDIIIEEKVLNRRSGATTGARALLAAMKGACPVITPADDTTADPTPEPRVIRVAGFAVARNTLPAASDEATAAPAPAMGCSLLSWGSGEGG